MALAERWQRQLADAASDAEGDWKSQGQHDVTAATQFVEIRSETILVFKRFGHELIWLSGYEPTAKEGDTWSIRLSGPPVTMHRLRVEGDQLFTTLSPGPCQAIGAR